MLSGGEVQLAADSDAAPEGSSDGATGGVDSQHPLYLLAVLLFSGEVESLFDPPKNKHLVLRLYLPHRVGVEVLEGNLTRYQRAPEGAEQSPTRCGYQVV
jgi:hypothetical protein